MPSLFFCPLHFDRLGGVGLLVLVKECGEEGTRRGEQDAKTDAQAPDGLGLEAVGPGGARPVAQGQIGTHGVEVLSDRHGESVGGLGIDLGRRLPDDIAIEKGQRLSQSHSDNDEGDEQEGIDARHDQEAYVRLGPIESNRDSDVERCDARNREGTNKLFGRLHTARDNERDEVGRDANDDDHGDDLENSHEQEGLADGHGAVAWDRHDE